ncbi:MAG: hydroxymethylbilane synthase [Actinobacteria bacterium]|nr:hydroxymethylbilane synthase [Actinomycetota bacterium]
MTDAIRLATRRSQLALRQSSAVAARLAELSGRNVELVEVVSEGDENQAALVTIGGAGVFVAAVRTAVLEGRADVAVHSLKDLPTAGTPGIELAAVPAREDPRDCLCAGSDTVLDDLPAGAKVGTGSPRRAAQLKLARADLDVVAIRGNVDSRLGRVGVDLDAVVLAAAGLARLGRLAETSEFLASDVMLPAPGQGALAVEISSTAPDWLRRAVTALDDPGSRACVTAERSMLAALEAGCSAPVGAIARVAEPSFWEPEIFLQGGVFGPDRGIRMSINGAAAAAEELGRTLAAKLLEAGAESLMTERNL